MASLTEAEHRTGQTYYLPRTVVTPGTPTPGINSRSDLANTISPWPRCR